MSIGQKHYNNCRRDIAFCLFIRAHYCSVLGEQVRSIVRKRKNIVDHMVSGRARNTWKTDNNRCRPIKKTVSKAKLRAHKIRVADCDVQVAIKRLFICYRHVMLTRIQPYHTAVHFLFLFLISCRFYCFTIVFLISVINRARIYIICI